MIQNLLEPSYYELLNKTKIYYVDIPKTNMNINNNMNKKLNLRKNSLEKIGSFLGLNIFYLMEVKNNMF